MTGLRVSKCVHLTKDSAAVPVGVLDFDDPVLGPSRVHACPLCLSSAHRPTYRLDRLYHRFLKPRGIGVAMLPTLVSELAQRAFIALIDGDRYSELPKLTSRLHRDELFKTINKLEVP